MLLISAAAAQDCCVDESLNAMGSKRCNQSDQCTGDRYCSSSNWCDGESNCSSDSCTPTTAVELPDSFTSEMVIKYHTNLNLNFSGNGMRRDPGACFFADPNHMVYNTDEYMVITAERTNATQGNDCLEWEFTKVSSGPNFSGDMFSVKA